MSGWTRIWAFTAFWIVYLTIIGCGVSFIQLQFFGPAIIRTRPGSMRVALTFDDGPDPVATPALLDLLKRENIAATFFCIGKNVAAHPDLARRIIAEGHRVENHTHHHAWSTPLLGPRALFADISKAQDEIAKATGSQPRCMRPPVGITNPHYARVLRRLNLKMVGWDVRSMDTRWPAEACVARVLKQTRDGSIILLHDGGSTPQRIEQIVVPIIQNLRTRGYQFHRLDHILADEI
jgi:peptidoglycan/xylan/chitin deacetylase (PgdA/CDA1 family)